MQFKILGIFLVVLVISLVYFLNYRGTVSSQMLEEVTLIVSLEGDGMGRVYNLGQGKAYECSTGSCKYVVPIGTKVSFVVTPARGSTFAFWKSPLTCRDKNVCNFVVDKNGIKIVAVMSKVKQGDEGCGLLSGKCMYGHPKVGVDCTLQGGRSGIIKGGLCLSERDNMEYHCCEPVLEEEDFVESNRGCEELGGECQRTNTLESCTIERDGGSLSGCYAFGLCRDKPQDFSEDSLWLCCIPGKEQCESTSVNYGNWENVIKNGKCPFSKPKEDSDRLACTQGPFTGSHKQERGNWNNFMSVDIGYRGNNPDFGTEYFIAPEDGKITFAKQRTTKDNGLGANGKAQLCGGVLKFKTEGGITYEIHHAFVFASILQHFDESGVGRLNVKEGEVIAKVANRTDGGIIEIVRNNPASCARGEHFHVKVTGVENCPDCHFVDDLDCNFFNPSDPEGCGRCFRQEAVEHCEYCGDCPNSSIQYYCKKDSKEGKCK